MIGDVRQYLLWAKSPTHRARVAQAEGIFHRARAVGPISIASSWGKDSGPLCDIAIRLFGPETTILHMASPYELPGYEDVVAHFSERARVATLPAARTLDEYVEWCRAIGLPHERSKSAQQHAVQTLKRDRGTAWAAEHGFVVQTLGMRIAEKGPRARVLSTRGPLYMRVARDWIACPLAHWTGLDVWAYTFANGVPYNRRIYDAETHGYTRETLRNTGWLSTDGADHGRMVWLSRHFPAEFRLLQKHFPQVRALR